MVNGDQVNYGGWGPGQLWWMGTRSIMVDGDQVNYGGWGPGQLWWMGTRSIMVDGDQVNYGGWGPGTLTFLVPWIQERDALSRERDRLKVSVGVIHISGL